MDIQRSERTCVEEALREDHPVRGDHHRVGAGLPDAFKGVLRLEGWRLVQDQSFIRRRLLHRAWGHPQAAPHRAVRLRQDQRDLMTGRAQRAERFGSELGCAGEDETQEEG